MRVGEDLVPLLPVMPQPVAFALGRVVRASGQAERLEACMKAAEVINRYVAVVGLASVACSRTGDVPPIEVPGFMGNLSFGDFEKAARACCSCGWEHPLREDFRQALRSTKKKTAQAGIKLEEFVQLRNELGHSLTPSDEPRARAIFEEADPIDGLMILISGLESVLQLPLMVVREQHHRRGKFQARLSFYIGEGEPIPREVQLASGIYEWETPYLCTSNGLIPLSPGLIFQPRKDGYFGLFIIDAINEEELRYKSIYDNAVVTTRRVDEFSQWVRHSSTVTAPSYDAPRIEDVRVDDRRSLLAFFRGEPVPIDQGYSGNVELSQISPQPLTIRDFEKLATSVGLGAAFRDLVYLLAEQRCKLEVSDGIFRALSPTTPSRVLVTIELRGSDLFVTILRGAFSANSTDEYLHIALKPSDTADTPVRELLLLFETADYSNADDVFSDPG
jgi:hypothetical protein